MPAHTSKEFVSVWEDQIRNVEINTMVSGNLPNIISQDINNVKTGTKQNSQKTVFIYCRNLRSICRGKLLWIMKILLFYSFRSSHCGALA